MVKCSYCSKEIEKGTGKMFISKVGKIRYFCSSKCEKNALHLKRDSKSLGWIRKKKK